MRYAAFLFTVVSFIAVISGGCQKESDNLIEPATRAKSIAKAGTTAPSAAYTLSNASSGNSVLAFTRGADGSLTSAGTFATGGLGTGGGLGSQGALVLSENNRLLFAVNAGSDEISVFQVTPDGLTWVSKVSSGGTRPISLTVHDSLVYVLNAGGSGNITGFNLGANGILTPLAGSTQPLSNGAAGPAQIEFNPDGTVLVVTEKANNIIDTYTIGADGIASGPVVHASVGDTPFGFEFDNRGRLIVSDAFGGMAGKSALSSYTLSGNGDLTLVTGPIGNTQTAACWVVITNNGKYSYTTNTGSGSISGYRIADDGSLTLLTHDGRTGVTGVGSKPIDMALSINSRYLYTLNAGTQSVSAFQVNSDGTLTSLTSITGLPASAVGLAAR
ncbi:MAG: beta-propeller fold lactonase family protein [Ignavibacteriae bacterium]|nr:beta-propeller fold lactonase family protein [Ignavibacteriota bacterium]